MFAVKKIFKCYFFTDYLEKNVAPSGKSFTRPRIVYQLAHDISLDDPVRVPVANKELLLGRQYIIIMFFDILQLQQFLAILSWILTTQL